MEAEGKEMAFKTKTVVRENTEYKVRLFKILASRAAGTTHLSSASVVVFLHSLDNEPTFNDLQIQLEMISKTLPESCLIAIVGTCHALCDECHGPGVDDCDSCSTNANKNGKGECECKIGFGGADCTVPLAYTGVCDDKCKNGCSGPTSRDCIDCIDNGVRDFYGNCVCDHGWSGLRCETQHRYNGRCFPTCATCNGPYASDCLECVDNAYKDMYGTCICTEYG